MSLAFKLLVTLGIICGVMALVLLAPAFAQQQTLLDYGRPPHVQLHVTGEQRRAIKQDLGITGFVDLFGMSPSIIDQVCGNQVGCSTLYEDGDCIVFLAIGFEPEAELFVLRDLMAGCLS